MTRQQRRPGIVGRTRARVATLTQWRDWNLPVKLGAVMLVPTLLAVVLGVVVIQGQVSSAAAYTGAEQRTLLAVKVRTVLEALQNERAGQANQKVPGNAVTAAELKRRQAGVDAAFDALRMGFDTTPPLDGTVESGWREAAGELDRLSNIRETASSPLLVPSTVAGNYTEVVDAVLSLERALLTTVADPQLAGPAAATYDIDAAKEEISFQETSILSGLARGNLLGNELTAVRDSKTRFDGLIEDLRAVGGDRLAAEYERSISGDRVQQRAMTFRQILADAEGGFGRAPADTTSGAASSVLSDVDARQWVSGSNQTTDQLNALGRQLSDRLNTNAANLQNSSSNRAGLTAVLLFVTLLAAATIVIVIARQLLRSMRTLHGRARTIAARELPEAVTAIQSGRKLGPEVAPVPVTTHEELGQLARAFDALHGEARRLATEQAALRTSYGNVFVNLSRRSQSLVQRQLRLIERLERDEEDPDQLATLFQLDHLATRMRRNNENLMVLSGSEQGRSAGHQPTGIADLLRAAVSEIEQYQRVEVNPPPNVLIVGYAAGDLVRLVAELLDNATAFSAPETQVSVSTSAGSDGSVSVDVIDQGVGMRTEDLATVNERLSATDTASVPEARRMGLFVVSRLAGRHGIAVSLHGGEDIDGVRACVVIPSGLVASTEEPAGQLATAERGSHTRDVRAESAPLVGPTMPATAAPFGTQADGRNGQVGAPNGDGPSVDDRPTEQYPRVPQQERAAASAWASGPSATDPASDELFTPLRPNRAPRENEQTPIFDEMLSAWFDASIEPSTSDGAAEPEQDEFDMFSVGATRQAADRPQWNFEADKGWEAVEAVHRSTPDSFTQVGLPRRTPRARLVPGSVRTEQPYDEPVGSRDPENVRHRLSSFQRGVSEGRADGETTGHTPEAPERADNDHPARATNGRESYPSPRTQPDAERAAGTDQASGDASRRWAFSADAGWRASEQAAQVTPEQLTNAGLPRRTPRARLVPGSAEDQNGAGSTVEAPRDAENVRDRLNSFQRGISDGRHSLAGTGQDTHPRQQEKE